MQDTEVISPSCSQLTASWSDQHQSPTNHSHSSKLGGPFKLKLSFTDLSFNTVVRASLLPASLNTNWADISHYLPPPRSWCPILRRPTHQIRFILEMLLKEDTAEERLEESCQVRHSSRLVNKKGPSLKNWPVSKILEAFYSRNIPAPSGPAMKSSSISPCVTSTFLMRLLFLPSPWKSQEQRRSTVHVLTLSLATSPPKLELASLPNARDSTSTTKTKIQSSPLCPTSNPPSTRWTPGSNAWRFYLPAHPKIHLLSPDHQAFHRRPRHSARPPSSRRTEPWELQSRPFWQEFLSFHQLLPSPLSWGIRSLQVIWLKSFCALPICLADIWLTVETFQWYWEREWPQIIKKFNHGRVQCSLWRLLRHYLWSVPRAYSRAGLISCHHFRSSHVICITNLSQPKPPSTSKNSTKDETGLLWIWIWLVDTSQGTKPAPAQCVDLFHTRQVLAKKTWSSMASLHKCLKKRQRRTSSRWLQSVNHGNHRFASTFMKMSADLLFVNLYMLAVIAETATPGLCALTALG